MKRLLPIGALLLLLCVSDARAEQPLSARTVNASAVITLGNTFQTVLAAGNRQSLTIANNNAANSCWIFVGSATASKGASILLLAGGAYTRYYPFVPSDAIQATCTGTNDTIYIDTQ